MGKLEFPLLFEIQRKTHIIKKLTAKQSLKICEQIDIINKTTSAKEYYENLINIIDIATLDNTTKDDILLWDNDIVINLSFLLIQEMFNTGFLKEKLQPLTMEEFTRRLSW